MTTELKKIPDSATATYINSLQMDTTDNGDLKPLFANSFKEKQTDNAHLVSRRIKREYPDQYWSEGCLTRSKYPHDIYMNQHVHCSICKKAFHSKFEVREHKMRMHAY